MVQWPPSPSVEDEDTALSQEHSLNESVQALKSDDQPALSRGSVDQYPIIIDSDDQREVAKHETKKSVRSERCIPEPCSSDDSSGPVTPPPLYRKHYKQSEQLHTANSVPPDTYKTTPVRAATLDTLAPAQGRPQVTRIQTDVGSNLRSRNAVDRREPSPYSYTRTTSNQCPGPNHRGTEEQFLSPNRTVVSPSQLPHTQPKFQTSRTWPTSDASNPVTSTRQVSSKRTSRSKSRRRGIDENELEQTVVPNSTEDRTSDRKSPGTTTEGYTYKPSYEPARRQTGENGPFSPPRSRRESKDSYYGVSGDDRSAGEARDYSRWGSREPKESPYTSSAEEFYRKDKYVRERSGLEEKKSRRKSSSRRERPRLTDTAGDNRQASSKSASTTDSTPYGQSDDRGRYQLEPMTPVSADPTKAIEDYFENAFRENDSRRSQPGRSFRYSSSAQASPMASPPRTPRSERQSKDYFDLTSTSQRPLQYSRPPSMDEGQIKDLKVHSSLLSAATTGAALAARASGSLSRTSGQSSQTSSSTSTSKPNTAPRSRPPSPIHEEPANLAQSISREVEAILLPPKGVSASSADARPVSRGHNSGSSISRPLYPQPHRALSYSGPENHQSWSMQNGVSGLGLSYGINPVPAVYDSSASQKYSAYSASNASDLPPMQTEITKFPVCPRSQPTVGYHDWYSIKGNANIDICPTCMSTVGNTRYRDYFVPSLPRPYNQPSVCALSSPWVRIAFTQSLRQNRPDLYYVKAVTILPKLVNECAGGKPDLRRWFDIIDPSTGEPVPNFFVCSACARKVDVVFPKLQQIFDRPSDCLAQEKTCSLHTGTKHFQSIIDHLEHVSERCKGHRWRSADVEPLVRYIRRTSRHQPCMKDELTNSRTWHFMADLPEFTICEDCYDEVVWPLRDRPIARDICKNVKNVPERRNSGVGLGISCQLYSNRMRRIFYDSVSRRDFGQLRDAARTRYAAHQRLIEMNKLYEQDQTVGIDRHIEMDRNQQIWRMME